MEGIFRVIQRPQIEGNASSFPPQVETEAAWLVIKDDFGPLNPAKSQYPCGGLQSLFPMFSHLTTMEEGGAQAQKCEVTQLVCEAGWEGGQCSCCSLQTSHLCACLLSLCYSDYLLYRKHSPLVVLI